MGFSGFALACTADQLAARCSDDYRAVRIGNETPGELDALVHVDAAQVVFELLGVAAPVIDRPTTFSDAVELDMSAPAAIGHTATHTIVLTTKVPPFESARSIEQLSRLGELLFFYSDDNSGSYMTRVYRDGVCIRRYEIVPPDPVKDEGERHAAEPTDGHPGDRQQGFIQVFAGIENLLRLPMESY